MGEEIMLVVRMPIRELANEVRSRNKFSEELFDAKLEGDNLVLLFKRREGLVLVKPSAEVANPPTPPAIAAKTEVKRIQIEGFSHRLRKRRKSRRNRMKTRGWKVVGKIVNSRGQTSLIYKPFVNALFRKELSPAQQRLAVAEILRSNGNDPSESSVEYFLTNTLEYLAEVNKSSEVTA